MSNNPILSLKMHHSISEAAFGSVLGLDSNEAIGAKLTFKDGKISGIESIRWLSGQDAGLTNEFDLELKIEELVIAKWNLRKVRLLNYVLKEKQSSEAYLELAILEVEANYTSHG